MHMGLPRGAALRAALALQPAPRRVARGNPRAMAFTCRRVDVRTNTDSVFHQIDQRRHIADERPNGYCLKPKMRDNRKVVSSPAFLGQLYVSQRDTSKTGQVAPARLQWTSCAGNRYVRIRRTDTCQSDPPICASSVVHPDLQPSTNRFNIRFNKDIDGALPSLLGPPKG